MVSATNSLCWSFYTRPVLASTLQWHHNGCNGISNHQRLDCLLKSLFRHRSKKTSKLRITGLCEGNSLGTGEFPTQKASNAENVSIWWRHVSVCVSLCALIMNFSSWETHRLFKLGSPDLDQRCKRPLLRYLLLCGANHHDLQGKI